MRTRLLNCPLWFFPLLCTGTTTPWSLAPDVLSPTGRTCTRRNRRTDPPICSYFLIDTLQRYFILIILYTRAHILYIKRTRECFFLFLFYFFSTPFAHNGQKKKNKSRPDWQQWPVKIPRPNICHCDQPEARLRVGGKLGERTESISWEGMNFGFLFFKYIPFFLFRNIILGGAPWANFWGT